MLKLLVVLLCVAVPATGWGKEQAVDTDTESYSCQAIRQLVLANELEYLAKKVSNAEVFRCTGKVLVLELPHINKDGDLVPARWKLAATASTALLSGKYQNIK